MSAMLHRRSNTSSSRPQTLNQRLREGHISSGRVSSSRASGGGVASGEGINSVHWPEIVDCPIPDAGTPLQRGGVAHIRRWIDGLPEWTDDYEPAFDARNEELAAEAANSNLTNISTSGPFGEPESERRGEDIEFNIRRDVLTRETRGIGASFRMVPPAGNLIESGLFQGDDADEEDSEDHVSVMNVTIESGPEAEVQAPPMPPTPSTALSRARDVPTNVVPGLERRVMEHPGPEEGDAIVSGATAPTFAGGGPGPSPKRTRRPQLSSSEEQEWTKGSVSRNINPHPISRWQGTNEFFRNPYTAQFESTTRPLNIVKRRN